MIYLLPDGSSMKHFPENFGVMCTHERYKATGILEGRKWAMDNCCYTNKFDWDKMKVWLYKYKDYWQNCLFITLPDVIGDAYKTIILYYRWFKTYKELGLPIAFVAQDHQDELLLPPIFDVLFIGGTTKFKISKKAIKLIDKVKEIGKWVHMGRVNYWKRINWAFEHKVDSVDGSRIAFQRNFSIKDLKLCMNDLGRQKCMF